MNDNEDKWEKPLRGALGARYRPFVKAFVMATGRLTEHEAEQVVALREAREREAAEQQALELRRAERERRYIRSVLYAGLKPLFCNDDDTLLEAGQEPDADCVACFGARDFTEVLRRCELRGFRVWMMSHRSETEELNKNATVGDSFPSDIFAGWRAEGCDELFSVWVSVPDEVVSRWEASGRA
jgi:hypothetical protein